MSDIAAQILCVAVIVPILSVGWDLVTYDTRMEKWEKAHPNQTYIRGYRRWYQCSTP